MEIVHSVKFAIGILFLLVGVGLLVTSRGTRGFGQRKQAGALMLVAGAVLVAVGLGFETPW